MTPERVRPHEGLLRDGMKKSKRKNDAESSNDILVCIVRAYNIYMPSRKKRRRNTLSIRAHILYAHTRTHRYAYTSKDQYRCIIMRTVCPLFWWLLVIVRRRQYIREYYIIIIIYTCSRHYYTYTYIYTLYLYTRTCVSTYLYPVAEAVLTSKR